MALATMHRRLCAACVLVLLSLVCLGVQCNADHVRDTTIHKVKHAMFRAKTFETDGKLDEALKELGVIDAAVQQWRESMGDGAKQSQTEAEPEVFEQVEFSVKKTHVPKKCTKVTQSGDVLRVHYVGKLPNGKVFASSFHTGSLPYKFKLGSEEVVEGWNQGLQGMCEGERRTLVVPPELGYGDEGTKVVPPGAPLTYHLELVEFRAKGPRKNTPPKMEL